MNIDSLSIFKDIKTRKNEGFQSPSAEVSKSALIYDFKFMNIDGYDNLNDFNKVSYRKFLTNILTTEWNKSKQYIDPKKIYYIEEISMLVENSLKSDLSISKKIIKEINKNGSKVIRDIWEDNVLKKFELKDLKIDRYLRLDYENKKESKFLRIINDGSDWY